MKNLIEARGLVKRYGDFALDRVDLEVPAGYVVGLVGSNGAGKTTIIKSLLGLIRPEAGEVRMLGLPLPDGSWRQRVGVVFDSCSFPNDARIEDIVRIGRAAYPRWDEARFWEVAHTSGIAKGKIVKDLSRGMGMKLSLAFALAHDPQLLILDEPTAGLDPLARGEVLDQLLDFMADGTRGILMATHITTDLERIADWIVCVDGGHVVFTQAKDDICSRAGIARCRAGEYDALAASGLVPVGEMRCIARPYGMDVLVPDRFALERARLGIVCEPASIDAYLELVMKGETR